MSSISQKKVKFSTGRNSFNNLIGNNDVNSLQKMFKKETKKMLFKHSLNESKKQNFQWYFKTFFFWILGKIANETESSTYYINIMQMLYW